jgi:hypothetical protein
MVKGIPTEEVFAKWKNGKKRRKKLIKILKRGGSGSLIVWMIF